MKRKRQRRSMIILAALALIVLGCGYALNSHMEKEAKAAAKAAGCPDDILKKLDWNEELLPFVKEYPKKKDNPAAECLW